MANDRITLDLSVEQVNLILGALAELPFRTSADMINEVRTQAQSQIQPEVDTLPPAVAGDDNNEPEAPAPARPRKGK